MTRNLMVAPLALMLWAHAAWAGAAFVRAASGDIPASSNCTRVSRATPAGEPYTAMRCPTTGGSFVLNYNYPSDATVASLTPRIKFLNPDASANGNYCFTICAGVVPGGQLRSSLDVSQCGTFTGGIIPNFVTATQDQMADSLGLIQPFNPNQASGAACTTANCSGAEMSVVVTRIVGGSCPGGNSTNNVDILGVSWSYN